MNPPQAQPHSFWPKLIPLGLVALAFGLRVQVASQSLWYDELVTLLQYIVQPWQQTVSGNYSPNNHILFTLLAKLCNLGQSMFGVLLAIRLPSLLAGSLAAAAIVWPMLRPHRAAAITLGCLLALHPWAISFSGWARGYALLLLIAIVLTNLLPHIGCASAALAYSILAAALLYTHPLGIGILIGHGVHMLLPANRPLMRRWLLAAFAGGLLGGALYLPFLGGARQYWSAAEKPAVTYAIFLRQSMEYAACGWAVGGIPAVLLSLLICTAGPVLAWRWRPLRAMIATFAAASVFALLIPILVKATGEPRAALWLIPLWCVGLFGLLTALPWRGFYRAVPLAGGVVAAVFLVLRFDALLETPAQPIVDAIDYVKAAVPPNVTVIGVYMAAREAKLSCTRIDRLAYALRGRPDVAGLIEEEQRVPEGRLLIVFYEDLMRRDEPELAAHIAGNYQILRRFPGRVSDVVIYRPK